MVGQVQLSQADQDLYDSIFTAAMEIHHKATEEPKDGWGLAIASLMMAILNGWERDRGNFPDRVVAEAWNIAFAWYELTGADGVPTEDI